MAGRTLQRQLITNGTKPRQPVSRWAELLRRLRPLRIAPPPGKIETGVCAIGTARIPYRITRSQRRKRTLALTIEPGATIRVSAPLRTSRTMIEAFIQHRADWIAHRLATMPAAAREKPPCVDGATLTYLGYSCRLLVTQDDAITPGCRLAPRRLLVNIGGEPLTGAALQQEVRLELMLWLKKRAKAKLQRRLDVWAQRLGVRYQKFILSSPGQRWGSCTVRNTIRLNWRLILAPLPLIDYVAAHELCHVIHKNHGQDFWQLLATVMPDYQERRRALRKFERGVAL
jgi:hypothetical protein